jgi:hypothetical protein
MAAAAVHLQMTADYCATAGIGPAEHMTDSTYAGRTRRPPRPQAVSHAGSLLLCTAMLPTRPYSDMVVHSGHGCRPGRYEQACVIGRLLCANAVGRESWPVADGRAQPVNSQVACRPIPVLVGRAVQQFVREQCGVARRGH